MARNPHYNPLLKSYPDSEKINRLSIGAESFYVRLIACTDDAARYWADPPIVMARLYTLRMVNGTVTAKDIAGWIEELVREDLIEVYMVECRRYLQMTNPFKTFRADVKKNITFPDRTEPGTNPERTRTEPGTNAKSQHNAFVTLDPDPHQTHTTPDPLAASPESESDSEPAKAWRAAATKSQIESLYRAYPRKVGKEDALKAIAKAIKKLDAEGRDGQVYLLDRVMTYAKAVAGNSKRFIPYPATWFNRGSYHDDPGEWMKEQDPEEEGDDGEFHPIRDPDTIYRILMENQ